MKIAYLSCSRFYGGVEKIVVDTLNELSKSNDVALIVPKNCEFLDRLDKNVKVFEYQSYDKRYNIFLYIELYKFLRLNQFEILHAHGAKAAQIGFVLEKILNLKLVATKHNNRKGKIFNRVKNVIAVSKQVASTINQPSRVLYFGISPKIITPILSDIFTITAVGRLDKIKGFDILISEAAKLNFPFKLQIIGDGRERQNLENLIKKLNLKDRVFLLGFQDDIPQLLANSHLQVISSHKEGLPITLMEGIFYSPIVISTLAGGGIGEILDKRFICHHENLALKIEEIYENRVKFSKLFKTTNAKFKQILTFQNYILELRKYYKGLM
ncbi:glycosyltransferase [Campylobacter geochelonis]|uniref:glycosyltransferase n=1 Tax=Campylobacter geochelonis TaxID=1780362 RepID=UPI000770A362|nr:glycosyltransferase [Campylobacter geochelonis]CZE51355.1 putative lipopolysaccharide biosynthesis protein [Campylobacter geochelonis]